MVTIDRPIRVPKNLRWVPYVALPVIALQVVGAWYTPPKPASTGTAVSLSAFSLGSSFSNIFTIKKLTAKQNGSVVSNGAQVNPGSTITYTLSTTNPAPRPLPTAITFNLSDVLQYSNVADANGATITNNVASWPKQDLGSKSTVTHIIEVRVHAIPSKQATRGTNYDSKLQADYGNESVIDLKPTLAKQLETAIRKLPRIPAYLAIGINLILLAVWALLRKSVRQQQLSKAPGALLLGWFIGGAALLIISLSTAVYSGFTLSGGEAIIGGLIGVLITLPVLALQRLSHN